MKTSETISPNLFEQPSALNLLTEFRKRYIPAIEKGVLSGTIDPYVLDYFDRELNRMIQAFVFEALKPWQKALTDAAMQSFGPLNIPALEQVPHQHEPGVMERQWCRVCGELPSALIHGNTGTRLTNKTTK